MAYYWQIVLFLEIISIFSVVFLERKKPSDALGWIVIVIILPGLGILLYLMFGDTMSIKLQFRYHKNKKLEKLVDEELEIQREEIESNQLLIYHPSYDYYKDIILMLNNQSKSICSFDNDVQVLVNGQEKYPILFEEIKNAKESISIAYYIISNNQVGWDFLDLLIEKAKEGVEIRLLYDFFGAFFIHYNRKKNYIKKLKKVGVQVYRFLPSAISSLYRINYRYHRKIVIIDGVIGYTGGINIGDEYLGKRKTCTPWRDTHLRMQGSCVTDLQLQFLKDWNLVQSHLNRFKRKPFLPEHYLHLLKDPIHSSDLNQAVQIVNCGPEEPGEEIKDSYIKMINKAREYIYIQTPYFIPDDSIMTALRLAINSGVDIKIMIPGVPDKKTVYGATLSHSSDYLQLGGEIYLYKGFIHSKSIVVDDFVTTIGTTNIDVRSFALDFETNVFIYDEDFAKENKEIFIKDMQNSTKYSYQDYKERPIFKRALDTIFRLFSSLM